MAWLNTAPDQKDGKPGKQTRRQRMADKGQEPTIPPLSAPYLARWLYEIGPTMHGGMGEVPLSFGDFVNWQTISGISLLPWEAKVIRRASEAYLYEKQEAKVEARPAPYTGIMDEIVARRSHVAKQVKNLFAGMKQKEG